ncbi:MAG: hypothetical protein JNJ58_02035 [Chitinophagaceae bacterium]|nr:hypothetical protein [Chitinophagaceae bacterium]
MNKLLLVTLFTLCAFHSFAQFTTLGKGPSFEEPEEGYAKVLLLADKRTAYVHLTASEGIMLKIYGTDRKQLISKKVQHKFGKLRAMTLEGCFEIDSTITLLISEWDERVPVLYRIILNENTGEIIQQEELLRLKKVTLGAAYATVFGGMTLPDFTVRKDPVSSNYAIASFNSFVSEKDRRVEVLHYNHKHELISKSYLSTPENKFKYVNILDIYVHGDKSVFTLIYAYNTRSSGGKENDLFLADFQDNNQDVTYTDLDLPEGAKVQGAILKYNHVTKSVHSLVQVFAEGKKGSGFGKSTTYFALKHDIINPLTRGVQSVDMPSMQALDDKMKELFGKKEQYSGVLQDFYINTDGGYTLILEGLLTEVISRSSGTYTHYYLGNIGVLTCNANHKLISSALIPKNHMLNNSVMTGGSGVTAAPLDHAKLVNGGQWLKGGNQFKSFAYVSGKTNNYVLVNEIEENDEKIEKGKLIKISGVKECDAFSFETGSGNVLPKRKFLFSKGSDHNLALLGVSDYNAEDNLYVTLLLNVDGRDRKVKVVWLKPQ